MKCRFQFKGLRCDRDCMSNKLQVTLKLLVF